MMPSVSELSWLPSHPRPEVLLAHPFEGGIPIMMPPRSVEDDFLSPWTTRNGTGLFFVFLVSEARRKSFAKSTC